jgi:dihydroorotate dehydrogenase
MLYSLARSALFRLDPEVAHDLTLKSLRALGPARRSSGAGRGRPVKRAA